MSRQGRLYQAAGRVTSRPPPVFVPAVVIAVIGVIGPDYLVQLGLGRTEPLTVALLANLAPVLTYLLNCLTADCALARSDWRARRGSPRWWRRA
jgi:drug/metabolite transporter (DMT)-like permease